MATYNPDMVTYMAMTMAIAKAMAVATAMIRPEHLAGARNHEIRLFMKKPSVWSILIISGPSRTQKWIRLNILFWKIVSGGLET